MPEDFPESHVVIGGGTTLDLHLATGRYLDLIDGKPGQRRIHDGEKGPFSPLAERFSQAALAAGHVELQPLNLLQNMGIELHVGGGAANCAAGAAHMGETATLVTILGNGDDVSQFIRQQLAEIPGLSVDAVNAGDSHKPRLGLNLKRTEKSNRVWLLQPQPEIPDAQRIEFLRRLGSNATDAKFVALSSLHPDLLGPSIASVPSSVPKAVNPASAWFGQGNSNDRLPELKEILYGSDLAMVAVNNDEMSAIHGDEPTIENAIRRARQMSHHVGVVVCTLGMEGSIAFTEKGLIEARKVPPNVLPEFDVENGGAGDASFIGTLVAVHNGHSLDSAMEIGRQNAGLAIMARGAHAYAHGNRLVALGRLAA